jgi:porphobilinogen deaminase
MWRKHVEKACGEGI